MRSTSDRGGARNFKSAQTRVAECLNYWFSLPETNSLVKSLVADSLERAGGAASSQQHAVGALDGGGATVAQASPPVHPSPMKPSPRSAVITSPGASSSLSAAADTNNSNNNTTSAATMTTADAATAADAASPGSDGKPAAGATRSPRGTPPEHSTGVRQHHTPQVQHCVDEMDFAHRIGHISPRVTDGTATAPASVKVGGGGGGGTTSSPTASSSKTLGSGGGSPEQAALSLSGSSPSTPTPPQSSLVAPSTGMAKPALFPTTSMLPEPTTGGSSSADGRARSPDAFSAGATNGTTGSSSNNNNNSSQSGGGGGGGDVLASSTGTNKAEHHHFENVVKSETTARIEAAVKLQDDPVPRASVSDIPRFFMAHPTPAATTKAGTGGGGGGRQPAGGGSEQHHQHHRGGATGFLVNSSSSSAAGGVSGGHATPSGLTEQQETAILTRIMNALANSGAGRKVPPKSAGAKISRTPTPVGGMTPLNAIVQITTESFGLPGVFAKIIHAKLVYNGKGNPPLALSSANVKAFYDNYIHGNSIERRMFEVLLGASEVNFPTPTASVLFGTGGQQNKLQGGGGGGAGGGAKNSSQQQLHLHGAAGGAGGSGSGRQHLIRADFAPLLQILLDHHPGLAFLKQTADFQARYLETVIIRIFFELDKNDTGKISWEEFRRSSLPAAIRKADSNEDINLVLDYFSYEHFYVLYCRFWELDTDKDFLISKDDLMRYYPENTTNPIIVEKIVAGVGRPLKSGVKGKMNFEDFVWFCLCEEYKAHPRAIAYWFRILDVDQDGIISGYELETFYQHTKEKMKILTSESIVFEDVMCQVSDMMSFSRRAQPPQLATPPPPAANPNNNGAHQQQSGGHGNSSGAARPSTATSNRPRSAAPVGSAARLMSAAPTARPVVGTDPREERRLSITSSSQLMPSSPVAGAGGGSGADGGGGATAANAGASSSSQQSTQLPSSFHTTLSGAAGGGQHQQQQASSAALSSQQQHQQTNLLGSNSAIAENLRLHLHAGFTLSDFLRCPTAAHVAINMLTNVSKFLQFEQRDPFVASHERANVNNNTLHIEGMSNFMSPNNGGVPSGPLERTEWDRFCRAEYDRMAADDDAP